MKQYKIITICLIGHNKIIFFQIAQGDYFFELRSKETIVLA